MSEVPKLGKEPFGLSVRQPIPIRKRLARALQPEVDGRLFGADGSANEHLIQELAKLVSRLIEAEMLEKPRPYTNPSLESKYGSNH